MSALLLPYCRTLRHGEQATPNPARWVLWRLHPFLPTGTDRDGTPLQYGDQVRLWEVDSLWGWQTPGPVREVVGFLPSGDPVFLAPAGSVRPGAPFAWTRRGVVKEERP